MPEPTRGTGERPVSERAFGGSGEVVHDAEGTLGSAFLGLRDAAR
jgi:hypothetical protein